MNSFHLEIQNDLNWREIELASLKLSAATSASQPSALRAAWALLYAHYEGFCLFSIRSFLERIETLKLPRKYFSKGILQFSLNEAFAKFRGNSSSDTCFKFYFHELEGVLNDPITFMREEKTKKIELKGKSNLRPSDLLDLYVILGFCTSPIELNSVHLKLLVERRNNIAHGDGNYQISMSDYQAFERVAINILYDLAINLINCSEEISFLDPSHKQATKELLAYRCWETTKHANTDPNYNWSLAEKMLRLEH